MVIIRKTPLRRTAIKTKLQICKKCKKKRPIFSHGLCQSCARQTYAPLSYTLCTSPKQKGKSLGRTPIKKKYKPTGELKLFKEIWEERPHQCAVCQAVLPKFNISNFAHILSKGAYRKLRLLKENIELLCFSKQGDGCHNKYDTAAQSNLIFGAGSLIKTKWKELFAKAYTLKQKYYAENKVTKK